jgi:hypothetical protein
MRRSAKPRALLVQAEQLRTLVSEAAAAPASPRALFEQSAGILSLISGSTWCKPCLANSG